VKERLRPGDVLLVKGSRGMRLERLVEAVGGASPGGEGH
jgi:UDP-N-acetylmuramoyl-tripeptide--D-alanyl-D-alanine ligase